MSLKKVVNGDIDPQILKTVQKECKAMGYDDKGIVCVVSRQAGTVVGTSVVISKKIAGCGVKIVTGAKDRLKRPLRILMPAGDERSRTTSEASALESRDEQATEQETSAKSLISTLESDLAAARHELQEVQSKAEKTQSRIALQLSKLQSEKESLLTELEQACSQANEAAVQAGEVKTQAAVLEILENNLAAAQHNLEKSRKAVKAEMPSPAAVTHEEAQATVFANATDKIIFTRALSDITSQDATVRADAAKTMACVHHKLSVKALVAQVASEPSTQVRQECIKALATLERPEALPTIELALTDEAGSVRLAAVWGLYHLAGTKSTPALIGMLADKNEEVRRRAATCIGWLGQEELAVELLPLLDDNSVSVRRAAVEAMGNLRSQQVVSSMIEHLKDTDKATRKIVLRAIEKITGKKIGKSFPRNEADIGRLIARWRQWWKEDMLK